MKNYPLNQSDVILEQVARIALTQNTELNIDTVLEICHATPDFSIAISKLLGVYVRPKYESSKIIKRGNLQIQAVAYDFDEFNNYVHYRYKRYEAGNYLASETNKELLIKTDGCSLYTWEDLETCTPSSTVDIAW